MVKGMGGAMDLVASARRDHRHGAHDEEGSAQDSAQVHAPLTGIKVVDTIVTELAVIKVTPEGLVLEEIAPDTTVEEVQKATAAKLIVAQPVKTTQL